MTYTEKEIKKAFEARNIKVEDSIITTLSNLWESSTEELTVDEVIESYLDDPDFFTEDASRQ